MSSAVRLERRGAALGLWGATSGLAVALGPVIGGAVTQGASWQWIFWLNVPIGPVLLPIAWRGLAETYGPSSRLDGRGLALIAGGLTGLVYGVIRGNDDGWSSPIIVAALGVGALLLAAFVGWERRAAEPMLPLRLFRSRTFTTTNIAALLFSFGTFGAIFLLAQYLQIVQGYGPLSAGLRTLPWTAMPLVVAPLAGPLSDRIGGRPLLVAGLVMQATGLGWLAAILRPDLPYGAMVPAFVLCGMGMSLFFVPVANVVLESVRPAEEGVASGTNNAIRELGGVFGIAVLGAIFSAHGGYASATQFTSGVRAAVVVGAIVVACGAVAGLLIPRRAKDTAPAAVVAHRPLALGG